MPSDSQYVRNDEAAQYVPLVPQLISRQSAEERIPPSVSSNLGDNLGGSPVEEEDGVSPASIHAFRALDF